MPHASRCLATVNR